MARRVSTDWLQLVGLAMLVVLAMALPTLAQEADRRPINFRDPNRSAPPGMAHAQINLLAETIRDERLAVILVESRADWFIRPQKETPPDFLAKLSWADLRRYGLREAVDSAGLTFPPVGSTVYVFKTHSISMREGVIDYTAIMMPSVDVWLMGIELPDSLTQKTRHPDGASDEQSVAKELKDLVGSANVYWLAWNNAAFPIALERTLDNGMANLPNHLKRLVRQSRQRVPSRDLVLPAAFLPDLRRLLQAARWSKPKRERVVALEALKGQLATKQAEAVRQLLVRRVAELPLPTGPRDVVPLPPPRTLQ